MDAANTNQTLEINPNHPTVFKLNKLRKLDEKRAKAIAKQLVSEVIATSAIPLDLQKTSSNYLDILEDYL